MTNSTPTKLNNLVIHSNLSSVVHSNIPYIHTLKGDSGATNHYLLSNTTNILKNIQPNKNIKVIFIR